MSFEESRLAGYAQVIVDARPSCQTAMALQPHFNELSPHQSQLGREADQDGPWRSHYEDIGGNDDSCPSEILIANEYELLKDAWTDFSEASQDKKSRLNSNKTIPLEWQNGITIDELKDSVRSAAKNLDESHGKTRRYFDRFCNSLSSHSAILEVLPNQSQYLSIFCGTVKTLLMASDNYRKTVEGLSKALAEIGDCIHLAIQHAKLVNTSAMREAVRQLYVSVFFFLRESMLWYKASRLQRLSKSFDQNFYDKFSDVLDTIKQRAEKIHTRGNVGHHAKTTDIIHMIRNMNAKLDQNLTTQDEDRRRYRELQTSQAPFNTVSFPWDQKAQEGCIEIGYSSLNQIQGIFPSHGIRTLAVSEPPVLRPYLGEDRSCSRPLTYKLQAASQGLDAHILNNIDPSDIIGSGNLYLENNLVLAIRDWSIAPSSMLLRISGNSEIKYPSATSAVSAGVVGSAFDQPLIHLFCGWSAKQKEASIISSLYSLIRQLTGIIDALDEKSLSFSSARFEELDGTMETWDKAILIFSELLRHAPSTLFVIIDGIERLEGEQCHQEYISSLINVLGDQAAKNDLCDGASKRLKVLFTTAGPCASLNKIDYRVLKTIAMKRQSTKRRPGEARLGRSQIVLRSENE